MKQIIYKETNLINSTDPPTSFFKVPWFDSISSARNNIVVFLWILSHQKVVCDTKVDNLYWNFITFLSELIEFQTQVDLRVLNVYYTKSSSYRREQSL